MITREDVATRLADYLQRGTSLQSIVEWAEGAMQEAEFEETHLEAVRDVVSRLGLADVRAFELTWEECRDMLGRLGYDVKLEISKAGNRADS